MCLSATQWVGSSERARLGGILWEVVCTCVCERGKDGEMAVDENDAFSPKRRIASTKYLQGPKRYHSNNATIPPPHTHTQSLSLSLSHTHTHTHTYTHTHTHRGTRTHTLSLSLCPSNAHHRAQKRRAQQCKTDFIQAL